MNITKIPLDIWHGHEPEVKYNDRTTSIRYIVLHTTGGVDSRAWLSQWNRKDSKSPQNQVSIHYLILRNGEIYAIIDENRRAWHVGTSIMPDGTADGNSSAIGIEIEHLNEPDYPEVQLNAAAELVASLMSKYAIAEDAVVSHASVARPLGRKVDPVHFDWEDFHKRVATFTVPITAPTTKPVQYTENSATLNIPVISEAKITEYIATKHDTFAEYTQADVRLICSYYIKYGKQAGIDWLFALAQSIHETGWFMSWWAARPRRNPAGIGVTGQTSKTTPKDQKNWVFDNTHKLWKRGQSFTSWDISVQHHVSRLLCYALNDENMTPEQLDFSAICKTRGPIPAKIRGCAPTLIGFNGTWAVPGTTYAQDISRIINSFIQNA